jgi:hypothetical protein
MHWCVQWIQQTFKMLVCYLISKLVSFINVASTNRSQLRWVHRAWPFWTIAVSRFLLSVHAEHRLGTGWHSFCDYF